MMNTQSTPPVLEEASDRGLILSMLVVAGLGILLGLGWFVQNLQSLENAPPPPLPAQRVVDIPVVDYSPPPVVVENKPLTPEQQIEQKLLNHPHVTPGRGFYKPGVQSTGNTIVDAVDHAKSNN